MALRNHYDKNCRFKFLYQSVELNFNQERQSVQRPRGIESQTYIGSRNGTVQDTKTEGSSYSLNDQFAELQALHISKH